MTVDKGRGPASPPLHVHVDEVTPVHVHIKKGAKKSATARAVEEKLKDSKARSSRSFGMGNVRPTTSSKEPWVPAPGKSTKGKKFSWQGPSHSLEINPPERDTVHATMRLEDLDGDYDDARFGQYEKKIDSLMTEVGTLKTERELERTKRMAERAKEELDISKRLLENQEEEITDYKEELEMTERENEQLRRSVDMLRNDTDLTRAEKAVVKSERERLLKKLVEVELDAGAASKQVTQLRDAVNKLREEKRISSHDSKILTKQRELLLQKLEDFERTNATLRQMLRDQHKSEARRERSEEQRDVLLRKLTQSDADNQRLRVLAVEKDEEIGTLRDTLASEREQLRSVTDLQASVAATRGHLQNQLRKREADCNRMAVQLRQAENRAEQQQIEVDHVQGLLAAAKEKAAADKEALKRATRVQKDRATRSEDAVERLNMQLLESETKLADSAMASDQWKARVEKLTREKVQQETENAVLSRRIDDLEDKLKEAEMSMRVTADDLNHKLHSKSTELTTLKLENDKLRSSLATVQDKLTFATSEVDQLKTSIHDYESLVGEYKSQMSKSRREALDASLQLEQEQQQRSRREQEAVKEMDILRNHLERRLQELEPLPEQLRNSEQKLLEATEKLLAQERRFSEQTKVISDLSTKVEHQTEQVETMRDKWHTAQDGNRSLSAQMESVQRRLQEAEDQNKELHAIIAKREETIHQNQLRLEDKTRENSSLTRQLEQAISDSRRLEEEGREKAIQRERNAQARIMDLESQLNRIKGEVHQTKRAKEDAERKFNSQLYDLKDRLEQSHSTNRSMQNYVQFLKNSYANVFGDTSLSGSPLRGHTPLRT
ncbi:outer dense fiber protein 2-like isoform X2 [Acanthaster planci]|uniref:Outer dense fiber protein 2-like isoform X2 n=1 Tax=Acanthaster planci TaxID=133434 RepID=A0A8B7Z761_ACAPL|nr:outer dense fiber protein 2-like isoform X2 [Acanthaster planci]